MGFTFDKKINNVLPERDQIINQLKELDEISKELQFEPKSGNVRKGEVMARLYKKQLKKELAKKKGFSFGA